MHLELLTKQVVNLVRGLSAFIEQRTDIPLEGQHVRSKGNNDYVTDTDIQLEKKLVSELGRILPEAGFIAEEGDDYKQSDLYNWVIDPLDGTTNFIHNLPFFAISIALMKENEVVSGVIYDPFRKEVFYAWWGGPAYLNDRQIHVSEKQKLSDTLIATGFPYEDFGRLEAYINMLKYLMQNTHGVRRLGSAALDLAYVACGRFDAFFEYGLKPWDVAAGVAIVRSAGGAVSDFKGEDDFVFGREILASGKGVSEEFLKITKSFFE